MRNFDKYLDEEEHFLKDSKKIKKIRKLKAKQDRSKYKKTDLKKEVPKIEKKDAEEGIVLSILGREIHVKSKDKKYICTLRGILKKEKTRDRNIVAVGDLVKFTKKNSTEGVIESINKRFSMLSRTEDRRKKQHIIAVNLDQVLITTSVVMPVLKPHLIDRYIIASQKGNMHPIIVINKIDLLKEDKLAKNEYLEFLKIYEDLGYTVVSISCKKNKNLKKLLGLMKEKTSVFSGQSGTGKSTIINKLFKTKFKTKEIVKKSYKGAHVTTRSQLVELKNGGFCIDTPGIKSFGIWDLKIEDINNYFFEIKKLSKKCEFSDCDHENEKYCNVLKALEKNKISHLRYSSYRSLIEETKKRKKYE